MDKVGFYNYVRPNFGGKLTNTQVAGFEMIINYFEGSNYFDARWLAYMLATVWHETGGTMEPVREGFCKTDAGAIDAVTRLYNRGVIKRNYALPHPNGRSYYGRGFVQITHAYNYEKAGRMLGMGNQLVNSPDLALNPAVAVKILVLGMVEGMFTTKRLDQYFNNTKEDWVNARKIINGLDKAGDIASYGRKFYEALKISNIHL